jgi:hypothetical protein
VATPVAGPGVQFIALHHGDVGEIIRVKIEIVRQFEDSLVDPLLFCLAEVTFSTAR